MKIIEPIDDLGALSTNNAPIDPLDTWAALGVDLLTYIDEPVFDISGNTMVAVSSTVGGTVYSIDLSTGIAINTGFSAPLGVVNIDLSPNESLVYINMKTSNTDLLSKVFDRVGGVVRYSSGAIEQVASNITAPIDNSYWMADSLKCGFVSGNNFYLVDVATWIVTTTNLSPILSPATSLEFDGVNFYAAAAGSYTTKLTSAGIFVLSKNFTFFDPAIALIRHNPSTGELLALESFGTFRTIDKATLDINAAPAGLSGSFFNARKSVKITATHLITRSQSTFPYWNYYLLSDYTKTNPIPALDNPGEAIAEATNYTVIQQPSGISILDASYIPLSQNNPSVIAGDSYIYNNRVYEVLIDNSDQPDKGAVSDPATWLDIGLTNPNRLFDGKLDSLTTSGEDLIIDITPAQVVSGIALFNVDAATIRVTMTDPIDGLVFDTGEISMIDNSQVNNWFDFYNAPYIKKSDFVSLSLPPYLDAVIEVTLAGINSTVSVGEVVLGRVVGIGISQFGSSIGILDFSEKEQDQFGNFSILKRKFSKRADYDVKIPTNTVSGAQRTLSKFRATPVVWVGDVDREETIIYGYFKSFDIVLSNPALSDTAILVEGL